MKLYTTARSSAAYRVRITLGLKGLPHDSEAKVLLKGEHLRPDYIAVNPHGLVPALEDDGEVLTQSLAIIEYLDERHPTPPLLPRDPVARAHVRSIALSIACDIHPLNNLRVLNYLRQPLQHDEDTVNRWYQHWIHEGFKGLEPVLNRHSTKQRYCFGDELTLADVCLVPQMFNARRYQCDLASYPTLVAIATHLEQLPAFAAAHPERQPDATA